MPFFIERIFDRRRAWHTHYLPFLERENGWKFDFWIVNVKWNCLMFRVTLLVCRFVVKLDHFLAAECVLFIYYFPSIFWVAFKTWSSHLTLVEDSSEFFSVFIFEKKIIFTWAYELFVSVYQLCSRNRFWVFLILRKLFLGRCLNVLCMRMKDTILLRTRVCLHCWFWKLRSIVESCQSKVLGGVGWWSLEPFLGYYIGVCVSVLAMKFED